ncbi:NACHT, LRR and PYD domains-containing protein 14 [Cyprinus carpio]|uniref:NACHT, LRR and PYD domains-containing protein 14 n=1 Tax=Cyprinus carpio TaxID=7962 RepID=A0A9R0ALS9_CYPCA|nr:NACHT, LRR and PYD domains-containing protein 14 [Cyprinus carpio]
MSQKEGNSGRNSDQSLAPRIIPKTKYRGGLSQTNIKHQKDYEKKVTDEDMILKLGKLAFRQLLKGNLIFYKKDLRECGIDRAVKEALKSKNGHLDLFLRFLLGLSVESNQTLLRTLLTQTGSCSYNKEETVQFIKQKIRENRSPEKSINLLCGCNLTAQSCGSLSSALQSSNSNILRELDLSNNDLKDSGVKLLSDGLKSPNCQLEILKLCGCNLTAQSCGSLSSALQSSNSNILRELDLSNNDLKDSGVKLLSDGLKSPNCQLEILKLSGCMVTEKGCHDVSSALSSNPSHLRELDLSYNHPGDSGVKLLSEKLEDSNCSLDKLNVDHGGESRITAGLKKWVCFLTLDPNTAHTDLSLSEENRKVTHVRESQWYPYHPDRFYEYPQVLCRESVCGRCYWEIECRGVYISVSYKTISRKRWGEECVFGNNDQSWSLFCSSSSYSFIHNNIVTDLSVKPISRRTGVSDDDVSRIGVYVDHSAGTLSFYSVSDTMSLIHTVQTTFTQPLYPGFWVCYYGSSVKLC